MTGEEMHALQEKAAELKQSIDKLENTLSRAPANKKTEQLRPTMEQLLKELYRMESNFQAMLHNAPGMNEKEE